MINVLKSLGYFRWRLSLTFVSEMTLCVTKSSLADALPRPPVRSASLPGAAVGRALRGGFKQARESAFFTRKICCQEAKFRATANNLRVAFECQRRRLTLAGFESVYRRES